MEKQVESFSVTPEGKSSGLTEIELDVTEGTVRVYLVDVSYYEKGDGSAIEDSKLLIFSDLVGGILYYL
jgi:hypothetical protein